MSGAERGYRIALRAFPMQYREKRGEEIVATILEGGDGWRPRLREFFGLFWAGIGQRSLRSGGEKTAGSVRAGIRLGSYALLWFYAATWSMFALQPLLNREISVEGGLWRWELTAGGLAVTGIIALLALSRGWWVTPFAFACAWLLLGSFFLAANSPRRLLDFVLGYPMIYLSVLVFLPTLLSILARPRSGEPRDLHSPLWAVAALLLGTLIVWQDLQLTSWLDVTQVVVLVVWLILGWRDLRLAIAGAIIAAFTVLELMLIPGPSPWIAPAYLLAYAFVMFAAVSVAIGLRGRRVGV